MHVLGPKKDIRCDAKHPEEEDGQTVMKCEFAVALALGDEEAELKVLQEKLDRMERDHFKAMGDIKLFRKQTKKAQEQAQTIAEKITAWRSQLGSPELIEAIEKELDAAAGYDMNSVVIDPSEPSNEPNNEASDVNSESLIALAGKRQQELKCTEIKPDGVKELLVAMRKSVEAKQAEIDGIEPSEAKEKAALAKAQSEVKKKEHQLSRVDKVEAALKKKFDNIDKEIEATQTQVDEVELQIKVAKKEREAVGPKIATIEESIAALKATEIGSAAAKEKFEQLETASSLASLNAHSFNDFTDAQQAVDSFDKDAMDNKMKELAGLMTKLTEAKGRLKEQEDSLIESRSALSKTIGQLHELEQAFMAAQLKYKELDATRDQLDKQLNAVTAESDETTRERVTAKAKTAEVEEQIRQMKQSVEETEQILAKLRTEIEDLSQALKKGRAPANASSLLDIQLQLPFAHVLTEDTWEMTLQQKQKEIDAKTVELAAAKEALAEKRGTLKQAQTDLEEAKKRKKAFEEDPLFKDALAKVKTVKAFKTHLQGFVDAGYAEMRYYDRVLDIAARRNMDFFLLLFSLMRAQDGTAGKRRQDNFIKYGGTSIKCMETAKEHVEILCRDLGVECSMPSLNEVHEKLAKQVIDAGQDIDRELDKAMMGEAVEKEAVKHMPFLKKSMLLFRASIEWFVRKDPIRFNEPLLVKYLNFVEDIEGAVRVYVKVTNREVKRKQPSNALIACAEQSNNLSYVPDRMIRIASCHNPVPWKTEFDSANHACEEAHEHWDREHPNNVYGPFFGVYASSDEKDKIDFEHNIPNQDIYGGKGQHGSDQYDWAPQMKTVLKQARSGYTIVLFGYGYSGTGKTYTLVGKGETPGILTLGLAEMQDQIKGIRVRFKELYGQIDLDDGRPEIGETGIFSYKVDTDSTGMPVAGAECSDGSKDCLDFKFWGRQDAQEVDPTTWKPEDLKDPDNFVGYMESEEHTTVIDTAKIGAMGKNIGQWMQAAQSIIQTTREKMPCRKFNFTEGCRHVRATPNNPESSRGHLFTILEVIFKAHPDDEDQSDKVGKIVIVDCAGSEDPVSIMTGYVDFAADGQETIQDNGKTIDVADTRASRYVKQYDRKRRGKPVMWTGYQWDHVVPSKRMADWQIAAAEQWLKTQPEEYQRIMGATNAKRDKRRYSSARARDDKLRMDWALKLLFEKGVIATVKEGVFINESLNHLKQFLLRRSGKTSSLLEVLGRGGGRIDDLNLFLRQASGDPIKIKAPGMDVAKNLPFMNEWDSDAAQVSPFKGSFDDKKPNTKYDPISSYYHPKQFIKPWSHRRLLTRGGAQPKKKALNTDPMISSARCVFGWPINGLEGDRSLNCSNMVVDGIPLSSKGKGFLDNGEVTRFDPMLMTSILHLFDAPQDFGKAPNKKPTKFLMMAAIRREHPEDHSIAPSKYSERAYKRLKFNICLGSRRTLNFADEMNPLSRRFQTASNHHDE